MSNESLDINSEFLKALSNSKDGIIAIQPSGKEARIGLDGILESDGTPGRHGDYGNYTVRFRNCNFQNVAVRWNKFKRLEFEDCTSFDHFLFTNNIFHDFLIGARCQLRIGFRENEFGNKENSAGEWAFPPKNFRFVLAQIFK